MTSQVNSQQKALLNADSYTVGFLSGGVASSMAEVFTLPLNTAKVRMMLYGWSGKYGSIKATLRTIKREQGFFALWNGLTPALFRQFAFSGIKLAIYDPIKISLCNSSEERMNTPLHKKIIAGVISGGLACYVVSTADIIETRMQDSEFSKRYKSIPDCLRQIYRTVGIQGLYKGLTLNIVRNALMNAAELSTYDTWRQYAGRLGYDQPYLFLLYGIAAGFAGALVAQPVDLLKTRVMNNPDIYRNGRHCLMMTIKKSGFLSLYNGVTPFIVRATSFNALFFLFYGYCRQYFNQQFGEHE
jgi:solute carrier family 25 (mitochondrial uncoupling protein), member 8/9